MSAQKLHKILKTALKYSVRAYKGKAKYPIARFQKFKLFSSKYPLLLWKEQYFSKGYVF